MSKGLDMLSTYISILGLDVNHRVPRQGDLYTASCAVSMSLSPHRTSCWQERAQVRTARYYRERVSRTPSHGCASCVTGHAISGFQRSVALSSNADRVSPSNPTVLPLTLTDSIGRRGRLSFARLTVEAQRVPSSGSRLPSASPAT